jgi:hypothetical protein
MNRDHDELMQKAIRQAKSTCREIDRVLAQAADLDLALEEALELAAIRARRAKSARRRRSGI